MPQDLSDDQSIVIQATNVDQVPWRHMAWQGHTELTHWGRDKMAATLADDTFKRKFVMKIF